MCDITLIPNLKFKNKKINEIKIKRKKKKEKIQVFSTPILLVYIRSISFMDNLLFS